jgi:hypothetical protein
MMGARIALSIRRLIWTGLQWPGCLSGVGIDPRRSSMSEKAPLPSVEERQAFAQKLGQFRTTLPANEQRMLDAMVVAAFTPDDQGAVQGYEWFYTGAQYVPATSSPNPYWYNGSGAAAWNRTPWGTTVGGLQTIYYPH